MEIKNKFWLVSLLVLVLSVGSVSAFESGCSANAVDYIFYDDFSDSDGTVVFTSHVPTQTNSSVIDFDGNWSHHQPTIATIEGNRMKQTGSDNSIDLEFLNDNITSTVNVTIEYKVNFSVQGPGALCQQYFRHSGNDYLLGLDLYGGNFRRLSLDGVIDTGHTASLNTVWYKVKVTYMPDVKKFAMNFYNESSPDIPFYSYKTSGSLPTSNGIQWWFMTSNDNGVQYADNFSMYYGDTCPSVPDLTPTISNQINHTNNRLNYTFSAQSDTNGQCTLWYDLDGNWIQSETKSVTADQQFNFTGVGFEDYRIVGFWNTNCSDGSGNEGWGVNQTFTIAKVQDSNTFDRVVFYINELASMIMEPFKEGWVKMTGNMYMIGDTNMTGDFTMGGNAGIGTYSPTQKLHVNDDSIRIDTANSCSGNCDQGELAWSATHLCVCTSTNTWKSVAIS